MSLRLRNPLKMLRSNAVALDFGSGQTLIASPQGEVLLDEPTVIALEQGTGTVIAMGVEAKSYIGKAPERIRVIRPIEAGVIVDFEAAKELLRRYLKRVLPDDGSRISACVVVSEGITSLEKRTFADCCKAAGISRADLVSAPLAAGIGAGLDIRQPKGRLILGIGFGLAEASVLCLSDVVHCEAVSCGSQAFHEAVSQHLAGRYQVSIGDNMAEQATVHLAWAARPAETRNMTLTGKYSASGTPCALELTDADLEHALDGPLSELVALLRRALERTPAELVADIADTGLMLYGDGALVHGLDLYFTEQMQLRARLAQDPQLAALRGAASALRPDLDFRKLLVR